VIATDATTEPLQAPGPATPPAFPSGTRSGAVLAGASAVSIVLNYVFLLATGRILGSDLYGSFAALLGLLAIVVIPATALQMAVSREVARRLASGDEAGAAAFSRATLRLSVVATVPLLLIALLLAVPIDQVLHIDSVGVVVLLELTLATTFVFPVAQGMLQGAQRFSELAALYVFPFVLRLLALALAAGLGYRLGGAVFATVIGAGAGLVMALVFVGDLLAVTPSARPSLAPFLRYLGPVVVGLVGIALLTHVDILIVKARFSAHDAGAYGAASAFARVGFFLPATILAVLFPRTAARQARGEETEDILGRSLLATAVFCALLALVYAVAGEGLVATTFGVDFAEGGRVLAPYAIGIGLFSLANILVGYHLSRGETRYAWIVAGAVAVQVAVLTTIPSSLNGVVWANVCIGVGLLAVHEVAVGSSVPAIRAGFAHLRGVRERASASFGETAVVLVGTTLFVCALFWRLVEHLSSTIAGDRGSDATGSVSWFWRTQHEGGFHLLGITHHTLTGAPFGWDQTNALNIQVALAYYPTYLAAQVIGSVAAFNLTTLAGYVLSGATMFLLVRYVGVGRLVSAWAALVYVVFPWHMARIEHASLLHIEVLALLVISLVAVTRQPSWLRFGFVAAANLACWIMSGYFGPMAAITTVAFAVGAGLTTRRWRRAASVVLGAIGCALLTPALFAIAAVVSGTNAGAGLNRAASDLSYYGLRPRELVIPAAHNLLLGGRLDTFWHEHKHGSNLTEVTNYLGLLTIGLAIAWVVFAIRRRREISKRITLATGGLVAAFVVGFAFAVPSPILLFGHHVWMPARLLWEVVPALRVQSRWDALLMTALVPLAALGLQAAAHALARRPGWRNASIAVVIVAMVVSFFELAIHPAQAHFRTVPVPPEYQAVKRTPPGILAEYPLGYSDIYNLWQSQHGRPILNGAPQDSPADIARLVLLDPSQLGTAEALALLGVTAITIHPNAHVDSEVAPREPRQGGGFQLVGRYPADASVWRVVARPAGALITLPGGWGKPREVDGGLVGFSLISPGGVAIMDFAAKKAGVVQVTFDGLPPHGQQRTLRLADSYGEHPFALNGRTRISIPVEVPRGRSRLIVKTDPAATSEDDAIVITAPRAATTTGTPTLRADLYSPDPGF